MHITEHVLVQVCERPVKTLETHTHTHTWDDKSRCCRLGAHVKLYRIGDPESLSLSATYFKCRSECHKCQQLCYRLCLHVSSLALDAKAHTLQTLQSPRVSKLTASNAEESRKTSYPCDVIHLSPFLHFLLSLSLLSLSSSFGFCLALNLIQVSFLIKHWRLYFSIGARKKRLKTERHWKHKK